MPDRSTGLWVYGIVGRYCLVGLPMSLRSGYCSTGRVSASRVCAALRPHPHPCLRLHCVRSQPLRTQKPSHCLYLRPRLSVPGVHHIRRRGLPCGVGPRVGTSKPTSPLRRRRHYLATLRVFWVLKNTRIAWRRRRVPPVRIRGGSAVFLSKVHSQRITVGGRRR